MNSKVTRIFADDREDWTTIRRDLWYLQHSPFLSERVEYIKVGLLPILKHGLPLISRIKRKSGLKVICDLKLSEVPFLSGQIAQLVKSSGADGIVVQGFAGIHVIDAVRDAAPELNIFLVTEMSHNGGGFTAVHLLEFAELAKGAKVFAVIGPGNRPERLKMLSDHVGRDVQVAAAGVSHHQGGSEAQAASMGANLVIDGRSLLDRIKEKKVSSGRLYYGM